MRGGLAGRYIARVRPGLVLRNGALQRPNGDAGPPRPRRSGTAGPRRRRYRAAFSPHHDRARRGGLRGRRLDRLAGPPGNLDADTATRLADPVWLPGRARRAGEDNGRGNREETVKHRARHSGESEEAAARPAKARIANRRRMPVDRRLTVLRRLRRPSAGGSLGLRQEQRGTSMRQQVNPHEAAALVVVTTMGPGA